MYALPPTSTLKSLRAEFKVLHPTPTASGEALKSVQSSMAPLPTALPALSMRTGRAQGKVCAHLCAVHEFVSYFSFSSLLPPSLVLQCLSPGDALPNTSCSSPVVRPLSSQCLLPRVCGSAVGDGGCSGQPHEAALHLLHEEGGGGGHHGGGMVLQARGR